MAIHLLDEIQKPYFQDLMEFVDDEYKNHTCYPPKELIFAAFNYCSFKEVKVVIIGQDPYHGKGEANGCVFLLMMVFEFRRLCAIFSVK